MIDWSKIQPQIEAMADGLKLFQDQAEPARKSKRHLLPMKDWAPELYRIVATAREGDVIQVQSRDALGFVESFIRNSGKSLKVIMYTEVCEA